MPRRYNMTGALTILIGMLAWVPAGRTQERVEVIPLNYIDAREAAEVINALYRDEVRAVPFTPTNSLLVDMQPTGAVASPAPDGIPVFGARRLPYGAPTLPPAGGPWGSGKGVPASGWPDRTGPRQAPNPGAPGLPPVPEAPHPAPIPAAPQPTTQPEVPTTP